jgi:hypothetical protein
MLFRPAGAVSFLVVRTVTNGVMDGAHTGVYHVK